MDWCNAVSLSGRIAGWLAVSIAPSILLGKSFNVDVAVGHKVSTKQNLLAYTFQLNGMKFGREAFSLGVNMGSDSISIGVNMGSDWIP